jgi:phosphodiesterase/alkaline phosphatase D-like protein
MVGVGGGAVLSGCDDPAAMRAPGANHTAIVLEPDTSSFVVAAWSSTARLVHVEVRNGDDIAFSSTVALDENARTVIEVGELTPRKTYQVTVTSDDGVRLGPHQVRTAPAQDDLRPVRIAVSADIDPHPDFASDIVDQLANARPELFVSLGDFPYTDNGPGPAMTVDEYRVRYAQALTEPSIRRLVETAGIRAIYDDHEFRNDWDGLSKVAEAPRYAAATQVWDEQFPLPRARDDVRYRSWRWGANVECFLLDCRRFRSPNALADTVEKTMLGATQLAWLVDGVRRSTATFKLIFTSVPLDFGDGFDHWAAFTVERAALFGALAGVSGVLFLSADQHWFGAHIHGPGLREFQVGPLRRGIGTPMHDAPGVKFRAPRYNFGLLDIDGSRLVISGVGVGGEVFYKETLTPADLTPSAPPF